MTPTFVLLLVVLIGVIAGLRSATAPAVVSYAAYQGWINLHGTPLSFMGSVVALIVLVVLALGELVADKLPTTPARTKPPGLIARIGLGGLAGACLAIAGAQTLTMGIILGVIGSLVGTFGGYQVRTGLVRSLKLPDTVVALAEDVVAVVGGLLIVSRF